ncbi:MAG TPA: hypothetical protein ENH02_03565, partial [Bacteroidetes bacterium]|nr:hypothetical protein [Bacteroidota bacterium]
MKTKKILLLTCAMAMFVSTHAQILFQDHTIIENTTNAATSVYATDIDGDGDMDMLSASMYDDKIAWYENTDG